MASPTGIEGCGGVVGVPGGWWGGAVLHLPAGIGMFNALHAGVRCFCFSRSTGRYPFFSSSFFPLLLSLSFFSFFFSISPSHCLLTLGAHPSHLSSFVILFFTHPARLPSRLPTHSLLPFFFSFLLSLHLLEKFPVSLGSYPTFSFVAKKERSIAWYRKRISRGQDTPVK